MIAKVRLYGIKAGKYDAFIRLFKTRAVLALHSQGMILFGLLSALILVLLLDSVLAQGNSGGTKAGLQHTTEERDGQHDFDFEFGDWKAHIKRLLRPLTGSKDWVDYEGISIVRKVWDGRANLGELEVSSATSCIEGLSLRLYNPQSHQWSIFWSNSNDGSLGAPMVGQFTNGRGEFYDQEMFQGKAIYVRFIFSDFTPTSFRIEQAFSADGGKTWETNWISTFTRQKP